MNNILDDKLEQINNKIWKVRFSEDFQEFSLVLNFFLFWKAKESLIFTFVIKNLFISVLFNILYDLNFHELLNIF